MHEVMKDPRHKFPKPGKEEKPQSYPGSEKEMVTKPDYGRESYTGAKRLEGKKAFITGGDSGIGRAVAVAFAKEGADIAISYLPDEEEDAEETKSAIEECGRSCITLPADFRDEAHIEGCLDRAVEALGGIDILVNNAALQKYFKSLEEITAADFEEIYRVNVVAPFVLSRDAAGKMQPGSAIINTVSIQAYEPSSLLLPYAASKGGFVALTKGLSQELIEKGIRVNAIAPGPIWSPLNTHASPPEKLKQFGENTPFGRPGQPVELAPLYVFLASEEGSYVTGEIFGVTGGEGIA